LTWDGRRLASFDGNVYTYDVNGLRTSKNNTEYTWAGDVLIGQKTGEDMMKFSDVGFNLNGVQYFYVKNLQGDITAIVDADGNVVAEYAYDAWSNVISATGDLAEAEAEQCCCLTECSTVCPNFCAVPVFTECTSGSKHIFFACRSAGSMFWMLNLQYLNPAAHFAKAHKLCLRAESSKLFTASMVFVLAAGLSA
jgi:YD repeat-containing protein